MISRDELSGALFLLFAGITGSAHSPGVSRYAGGASAPHAKRDQADDQQHGGKQGGKGSGPDPKNKRHSQESQQRGTRGTAHRGGQPRRQQQKPPRPAHLESPVAGGEHPGGVPEV